MRHKRDEFERINQELDQFISSNITIPFNLQTAELLLSAFIIELAVKEFINEDEFFGMLIAAQLIKTMAAKEL